jgi:uncharacterized protein YjbI with pentapeptide repeats
MLPKFKAKKPPSISEDEISKKAQELGQERKDKGILGSREEDLRQAKKILEQERLARRSMVQRGWATVTRPFRWAENRVVEPFANWLDQADIFRIIEKVSPALEAIGVIMIPVVIWWMTESGQEARDRSEKAARAQEAVKAYLNQLSIVFLDGNIEKDERLRTVTRASTLALLQDPNLEGSHKGQVVRYLIALRLVQDPQINTSREAPIISLAHSNLGGADLTHGDFGGADLIGANLNGASLSRANFIGAYLSGADLSRADLSGASLSRADLSRADLSRADLRNAFLSDTSLSDANLNDADLSRAFLSDADLSGAKLCNTKLPPEIKLDPNRDCKEFGITP